VSSLSPGTWEGRNRPAATFPGERAALPAPLQRWRGRGERGWEPRGAAARVPPWSLQEGDAGGGEERPITWFYHSLPECTWRRFSCWWRCYATCSWAHQFDSDVNHVVQKVCNRSGLMIIWIERNLGASYVSIIYQDLKILLGLPCKLANFNMSDLIIYTKFAAWCTWYYVLPDNNAHKEERKLDVELLFFLEEKWCTM
jgi:hypothetical protein